MQKVKRATNFSTYEEELLVSLVAKRKDVLECKKTDINSSRLKELEWQNLSEKFNANNAHPRYAQTLRRKYENIKKRTKKKYADEKVYLKGTGGGPSKHIKFSYIDESLKSILGTRVTGKRSEFDDDHDSDLDDKENSVPKTRSPLVAEAGISEEHITIEVDESSSNTLLYIDTSYCEEKTEQYAVSTNQYKYNASVDTVLQQPESISPKLTTAETKSSTESPVTGVSKNISLMPEWSDRINQVQDTGGRSEQFRISRDWSKYDPAMIKQPRSTCLMPSAIRKKMSASALTPRRIAHIPESTQKSPATPKLTTRKHSVTVWCDVGKAKLDLINIQKQIIMEEHQQQRQMKDEIHALTLEHMTEEHAIKIKILNTALMLQRK